MAIRARLLALASVLMLAGSGPGGLPAPVSDAMYPRDDPALAVLGRLLFWDPILSGNRNISCGTCHNPRFGTSDALSLTLGEGGLGLGPARQADPANPPARRVARNTPALFNLGAREFTRLFLDGRVEAGAGLPPGLTGVLAAQALVPVVSPDEMSGQGAENDIAVALEKGATDAALAMLAARVAAIPEYRAGFAAVVAGRELQFTDIANALAAFIAHEWRSDDSPFDRHLRGEAPLTGAALAGMELFYGKAGCAACHSGPFQTDHGFHAMGQPQIGPEDEGRFRVTGVPSDLYAFRTPSLRNVALTAPYGHSGAYATLPAFLTAHLDPRAALSEYDRTQARLPELTADDWATMDDPAARARIAGAVTAPPVALRPEEIEALYAFLLALTGDAALSGQGAPDTVPSGLPVDR